MIKAEYVLEQVAKQIKNGQATIVKDTALNKKTIVGRNIIGHDYVVIVKKNNKSKL